MPLVREGASERAERKSIPGRLVQEAAEAFERQADIDLRLTLHRVPERALRIQDLQVRVDLGEFVRAAGMYDQSVLDLCAARSALPLGQGQNMEARRFHECGSLFMTRGFAIEK